MIPFEMDGSSKMALAQRNDSATAVAELSGRSRVPITSTLELAITSAWLKTTTVATRN